MARTFCTRCGRYGREHDLEPFDPRFCWRCFDGVADAHRAAEIIAASARSWAAQRMLGDISDPRALDVLVEALRHVDEPSRESVLSAIGRIGDPAAVPAVAATIGTSDVSMARSAMATLGELGGAAAVEFLASLLDHADLGVDAAIALAWHRDPRAFDVLIGAGLADTTSRNRARTPLVALSWLGDRRAVPVLCDWLRHLTEAYVQQEHPANWAIHQQAQDVARVLLHFGGNDAASAVDRAHAAFPYLNLAVPLDHVPVRPAFPALADEAADPRRTVPKWSLELVESKLPISEPVTKFGGQPVWLTEPTWPLTNVDTPMTFFAQFEVPGQPGALAYLFIDPNDERDAERESGANAVFVQPGATPPRSSSQATGPSYVSDVSTMTRFVPRMTFGFVEQRAVLAPGLDPADWQLLRDDDAGNVSDWNKVGGTPLWLQYPDAPEDEEWTFLFQFSANAIGHEFGDAAECYGFVSRDGHGAFTWQCH